MTALSLFLCLAGLPRFARNDKSPGLPRPAGLAMTVAGRQYLAGITVPFGGKAFPPCAWVYLLHQGFGGIHLRENHAALYHCLTVGHALCRLAD
jgi:hypothetical protein